MKVTSWKRIRFITLIVWISFSIGIQILESIPQARNLSNDFYSYYVGSKLLWMHKNPYLINNDFLSIVQSDNLNFLFGTGYSYPPLLAFIFYPFTLLEAHSAARIWQLFSCLLYAGFIYKVLTINKHLPSKRFLLLSVVLVSFIPILGSIAMGQANIVILLLLVLYFFSKNELLRASGLAIASLIKVYPILFLIRDFVSKQFHFIGKFIVVLFFFDIAVGVCIGV